MRGWLKLPSSNFLIMKTDKIVVDNLKCGGCANSIKKALNQIVGVMSVEINEQTNTVIIDHEGQIPKGVFLEKLAKLGYPAAGTSTKIQKAKSYLSCAIGRLG